MIEKIIIIASEFPPGPGGIGNHAYNLAKWLVTLNYKVEVISERRYIFFDQEYMLDKNLNFNIKRLNRKKNKLFNITYRAYEYLKIFLNIGNNDLIIATGKFPMLYCGFLKFIFSKIKIISVVHGSEVNDKGFLRKKIIKVCLKKIDKIISVSNFTKEIIHKLDDQFSVIVINNGFDTEKFKVFGYEKDLNYPKFLTIGNVTRRKGQSNVIRAIPGLLKKFPKVIYNIIGLPTIKEELKVEAEKIGVSDSVIFHGVLDDSSIGTLIDESNICIMLSEITDDGDVEGFGISIIESNFHGLPSIGSKSSGIQDAIKDNYSGFLINENDENQIVLVTKKLLDNHSTFSKNAIKWSMNFKWSKIIAQYDKVIKQVSLET
jgi:phosphatidyl-myo-inositol dimannoside synthase